jgi:hypothetical protein
MFAMTHQEKVAHFKQLLRSRGYWLSNAIPPATHILWWLGLKVPPPYFLSFTMGALTAGISFGIMLGLLKVAFALAEGQHIIIATAISSCVVGTFFGLCMATFWRSQARQLQLSTWHDYPLPCHQVPVAPTPQPRSGEVV